MSTKTHFNLIKLERTKITDVENSANILEINQIDFTRLQHKLTHLKKSSTTTSEKPLQAPLLVIDLTIWRKADINSKNYENLTDFFNNEKIQSLMNTYGEHAQFSKICLIAPELWQKLLLETIIFWWKLKAEYEIVDTINDISL